jgi:hypothetical protein
VTARLLLAAVFAFAQLAPVVARQSGGAIRGTVVDASTRQPLVGVLIHVDGDDRGVRSGADGRFDLPGLAAGTHSLYLSIVGYTIVKRDVVVPTGGTIDVSVALSEGAGTYAEDVHVTAADHPSPAPLVAAQHLLGSADLQNLRGVLTDDPMRAVQALPGVTANDDLRAEVAVRGSDFAHVGVLVDGVESRALMHAVRGTQDGGSIAMINSDVLEHVSLFAGSYPQRYGNRTGAEIGFTMRDGARDRVRARGSISGTAASTVVEGPLGSTGRGSWLAAARKSYLDLIVNAVSGRTDFDLGFVDTQGKLAYDLSPRHRIEGIVVAGRSHLHDNPATAASSTIVNGLANAGLGSAAWIATPGTGLAITQRISFEVSRFKNDNRTGLELDENARGSTAYRVDLIYARPRASYEAGVQAQHQTENGRLRRPTSTGFTLRQAYDASTDVVSAFARTSRQFGGWSVDGGSRVDRSSFTGQTVVSPWIGVGHAAGRRFAFRAGSGQYHQFPELEVLAGSRGTPDLRAERATHVDAGVEGNLTRGLSWQAVVFAREQREFIRLPDSEARLENGRVRLDQQTSRFENRLDGRSRGFELTLQRRSSSGLSGWASYSYAATTERDRVTGETFRADFDQRHTVNVYAYARLTRRLGVAAKMRGGSGTPLIGYFEQRGSNVFVSANRNALELPRYARIDLRANRVFDLKQRRITLFAEILNVLNRTNLRQSGASVNRTTGLVTGIYDSMAPIVPSLGLLVEF